MSDDASAFSTSAYRPPTTDELAYVQALANPKVIDKSKLGSSKLDLPTLKQSMPRLDYENETVVTMPFHPSSSPPDVEVKDEAAAAATCTFDVSSFYG